MYETKSFYYGTGRRKNSVARVRLFNGTGKSLSMAAISTTTLVWRP